MIFTILQLIISEKFQYFSNKATRVFDCNVALLFERVVAEW